MYIPKINLPPEGVEHARWLEGRSVEQQRISDAHARELAALRKAIAAGARQAAGGGTSSSGGLPSGGRTGSVLRKASSADGDASWTPEWQGLLPEYWVTLQAGSGSYTVTPIVGSAESTKALLPPLVVSDGGTTLEAIDHINYGGPVGGGSPFHLHVNVVPTFDGEEFTVRLPYYDNMDGPTAPYYTFHIENDTAFEAHVFVPNARLHYLGTNVRVLGAAVWDLPSGFDGAWHVLMLRGYGTAAIPARGFPGTVSSSDPYYDLNVAEVRRLIPVQVPGVLTVATVPHRIYNDTVEVIRVGKVSASVGTAPAGSSILLDVLLNGVDVVGSVEISAGTNHAIGTLTIDRNWDEAEYLTVDVTQVGSTSPGSDLTVQIWTG